VPAEIYEAVCSGCGLCAETCPAEAIYVDDVAKVNADLCTGCGTAATVDGVNDAGRHTVGGSADSAKLILPFAAG